MPAHHAIKSFPPAEESRPAPDVQLNRSAYSSSVVVVASRCRRILEVQVLQGLKGHYSNHLWKVTVDVDGMWASREDLRPKARVRVNPKFEKGREVRSQVGEACSGG